MLGRFCAIPSCGACGTILYASSRNRLRSISRSHESRTKSDWPLFAGREFRAPRGRVLASTDLRQPRLGRGAPRFGYSVRVLLFGFAPLDKYSPFAFLLDKVEHSLPASHRSSRNCGHRAVGSRPHQLPTVLLNEGRSLHMAARGMRHRTVKTS